MHHGTVSCADRLSQGVIAWPQVRRIPMKTSKKPPKKKNNPKKSAPAAGHGTPSPPRMDTLWGPRAGPELTLSLAAGAHTSAGAATLARTVPFWGRFRSPREPTAGPCRGCLLPSATNTAPSRHHLQAVLCDGWDVQTPPSWLLRPQTRELYGWS